MADEATVTENVEVLSKEAIAENKKMVEEAKKALTPPEGKVFVGMRAFCPIHGDITQASKIIKHTRFMKNEETGKVEPVGFSDVVCLACVSNMWRDYMEKTMPKDESGNAQQIQVSPIFMTQEELDAAKKKAEEMKKAEEAKKAAGTQATNSEEVASTESASTTTEKTE